MADWTNHRVVSPSYSYPRVLGLHPPSPPELELEGQYPNAPNDVVGVFRNEIGRIVGVESETSNLIPVSLQSGLRACHTLCVPSTWYSVWTDYCSWGTRVGVMIVYGEGGRTVK